MKRISLVLVVSMLLTMGNVFANGPKIDKPEDDNDLSVQIAELLKENTFSDNDVDLLAYVKFTLNEKNEIVVLSVNTADYNLEAFVKSRLNYQIVDSSDYKEGKLYVVPVRVLAGV